MSPRKYITSLLVTVFLTSSLLPVQIFASGKQSNNISKSRTIQIPREIQERFKKQKSYLQSKGNPLEYQKADIQWDVSKQKPSHIRGISKKASKNIVADTKQVLKDFAPSYGLSTGTSVDIRLARNEISKVTKERHTRLNQFYNNLEIVGGEILAHTDENGILYQVDGTPDVPSISTTPSISKTQALSIGTKEHGAKKKFEVSVQPELVLYKLANTYILAYRYEVSYDDPIARMGQWIYYIDAQTGKKITAYNKIHDVISPASISGSLLAGEGGSVKTFTGIFDTDTGKYYMHDAFSASGLYYIFNASSNTGAYTDAWDFAQRTTSDWGMSDRTEVSAGYNMAKTLEYFSMFGFGVDDIIFTATGQVHMPVNVHYGTNYNNAYWSPGVGMYFGDGDGINLKPLVALDVMAHEFGHAWTENTSDLVYQNEPGALNESFSDISGVNVEMYAQAASNNYPDVTPGQADWLVGEDVMIGEKALRDMRNPANTVTVGTGNEQPTKYHGTYWYFGSGDNGWVHYNSSVQNFFYYLLSEGWSGNNDGVLYSVDGIGLENARRIAFEANTHFFTSTTTYKDARQAWIDAATSIDPNFVHSVEAAWDAVDIAGDLVLSLATADESFENSTDLPSGYTSSVPSGSGGLWSVTTSTGALGNNSLVSGMIEDASTTAVSWSGVTDAGYTTFYWRTSSEAAYDTLDFYIDGVQKGSWSGLNPWSFYSEAITSGSHTFTWEYNKDIIWSWWLDQVGIDAVHTITLTGSVSVTSDTATGQYVSPTGLHAQINVAWAYDYIISRSDGQMARWSATDSISIPLTGLPEWSGSIDFQYRDSNGFLSQILTQSFFLDSTAPSMPIITSTGALYNTGNIDITWDAVTDTGAGLSSIPYTYSVSTDSNFINIIASGSTSSTGTILTVLSDGTYFVKIQSQDLVGNVSTSVAISFIIDTISPILSIDSHSDGAQVIWSTIILTGSISDSGGIAGATLNSESLSSFSDWSQSMSLTWGNNTFILSATDFAGNTGALAINIERIIAVSNIVNSPLPSGVRVDFDTDLTSTGVILYGTDSANLNLSQDAITSDGIHQSVTITGLAPGTVYYYTLQGDSDIFNHQVSAIQSFVTPDSIDIITLSSDVSAIGSLILSGVLATGSTVFSTTNSVSIVNENTPTDGVSLSLSGLTITTIGTGEWDGIFLSPRVATLSGITLSGNGYTHIWSVYKAGNDSVWLSLSWQVAHLQMYLGTAHNGEILRVYRSDVGDVFDPIDICTVSSGICQFTTNHFSFFAFGAPSDSVPDGFAFTDRTGVELSTNTDSNQIVVSGINLPSSISVSGGMYSINSTTYTGTTGTVSNGDTIKVQVTSSSSYNTIAQTILTIGGVSATFRVTTKAAPVISSGGGGGGWGSVVRVDSCPNGDTSPSYYDGMCGETSTQGVSVRSSAIPQKAQVSRSGFLSNNQVVAEYDFTTNKRIPQKVAAELNFFITKLTKILDTKSEGNESKRQKYYQAVSVYIANRAQQTSDTREKRIMEYLGTRLVVVGKGIITQQVTTKIVHKNIPSKVHK